MGQCLELKAGKLMIPPKNVQWEEKRAYILEERYLRIWPQ